MELPGGPLCCARITFAPSDAPLVARLREAGAILVGNTNTPEFLMAYENRQFWSAAKTSNPWDLSRSAGGSSGGEAAAIASGCSAGGVGSDGGGSIRVPSHFLRNMRAEADAWKNSGYGATSLLE